jgi:hypothetical protein
MFTLIEQQGSILRFLQIGQVTHCILALIEYRIDLLLFLLMNSHRAMCVQKNQLEEGKPTNKTVHTIVQHKKIGRPVPRVIDLLLSARWYYKNLLFATADRVLPPNL